MGYKRKEDEKYMEHIASGAKKFVKYDEGAQIMSMEIHAFMELAKEAKAVYHIRRMEQVIISLLTKWKEESSTAFVKPDVE